MHIFISYSRRDSAFANHLHSRLTNANFSCLLDKGNKTAESALSDADKKNIKDSFALIVVMTGRVQAGMI